VTQKKPTSINKPPKQSPLTAALFQFQIRFEGVEKVRKNDFTNSTYASLDDVMHAAQPLLTELELAVIYRTSLVPTPDGSTYVTVLACQIIHLPSNEVLESQLPLPDVADGAPIMGSYMTYWRRYLFCGMANIVESADDDGNATRPVAAAPRLTEKQHGEILDFVEATGTNIGSPDVEGSLLHHINVTMGLTEIEQLSSKQASTIIKMLRTKLARLEKSGG